MVWSPGLVETKVIVLTLITLSCFFSLCNAFLALWQGRQHGPVYTSTTPRPTSNASVIAASEHHHWVDVWLAAPQPAILEERVPPPFNSTTSFANVTIRQTIRLTSAAEHIRLSVSNAFGPVDLAVTKVTLSYPLPDNKKHGKVTGSSRINGTTICTLTFGGNTSTLIPPAALAISDPVEDFQTAPGQLVSISMYFRELYTGDNITSHIVSRTTSWFAPGDQTSNANMTNATAEPHWYFISAVSALLPPSHHAVVTLGDSITDGRGSHINSDQRWPDLLFDRLQNSSDPTLRELSVVNQALGGNQVLATAKGPGLTSRLDRDVLSHSSIRYALLLEGLLDIGHAGNETVSPWALKSKEDRLIQYYKQIITRLHSAGVPVFGATVLPTGCANVSRNPFADSRAMELTRLSVNKWIRESGWFDAVIDFDEIMRDPRNFSISRMREDEHAGDCIHPNELGARRMAEAFPVDVFRRFRNHGVWK